MHPAKISSRAHFEPSDLERKAKPAPLSYAGSSSCNRQRSPRECTPVASLALRCSAAAQGRRPPSRISGPGRLAPGTGYWFRRRWRRCGRRGSRPTSRGGLVTLEFERRCCGILSNLRLSLISKPGSYDVREASVLSSIALTRKGDAESASKMYCVLEKPFGAFGHHLGCGCSSQRAYENVSCLTLTVAQLKDRWVSRNKLLGRNSSQC